MSREVRAAKDWIWLILAAAVAAGAFARFYDLAWHFSHPDDVGVAKHIVKSKLTGNFDIFAVSHYWTYAPFQFLFTNFLISPEGTYREFLFWGRLPSAIAGMAGIFLTVLFYRRYDRFRSGAVMLGAAMVACSFENVIFAKQMSSYGIGVPAALLVLWAFLRAAQSETLKTADLALLAFVCALASHMQYQVLFLMPAVFLPLWLIRLGNRQDFWKVTGRFLAAGCGYLLLITPLVTHFILRHPMTGAYIWTDGENFEFSFMPDIGWTLWQYIRYTINFFTSNLVICFDAMTAFMRPEFPLYHPVMWFFSLCFLTGGAAFCFGKLREDRALGLFIIILFVTWFGLVLMDKLSFSPTRHSLILLPAMVLCTVKGLEVLTLFFQRLFRPQGDPGVLSRKVFAFFAVGVVVLFSLNLKPFFKERRDVFVESEVLDVLKKYNADSVLILRDTAQVFMMKSVAEFIENVNNARSAADLKHPYKTLAWISRISKMHPQKLKEITDFHNKLLLEYYRQQPKQEGQPHPLDRMPYSYRVVYSREIDSNVEIEFSSRTKNGTNALYFYILQRDVYPPV